MLTFITGTYFSAKKEYINSEICRLLEAGRRVYLIVPEQSSFDRDRDFLFAYGEKLSNLLTVTSFTHLSRDVLDESGLRTKPQADEAARNVLMSLAVEECSDNLGIYGKYSKKPLLVGHLLGEYDEIKQAGFDTKALYDVSNKLGESTLKAKTQELARIFSAYEALITDRFSDATDNVPVMTQFLRENHIFKGAYVFFDDFRGFTGAQIKLISEIISQAEESFISVCAPDSVHSFDSEAFSHAVANCRKIRAAATLRGVDCREKKLEDKHPSEVLSCVSDSLFCGEKSSYAEKTDAVTIISAENLYSECDTVALEIKKLLEAGKRCRDIAVYDRDGSYVRTLTAALKKYNIPVFRDKRISLFEYPLVRMILSAVNIAAFGFSTEDVLSYIKTDIVGVSAEECALLENYVYVWQIDRNAWTKLFTGHPDGYGQEDSDEARDKLATVNAVRDRVVGPLLTLKKKLSSEESVPAAALFEFLTELKAADNFRDYAKSLFDGGQHGRAGECAAVWDTVMQSLDALYGVTQGRRISAARFGELLKLIFSGVDIGRIPAGIDEIVIGQAGRTRHLEPDAVFVMGCNDGVFPQTPSSTGLFSFSEKRMLCSNGFMLENVSENIYAEERMIAYSVLTGAAEKLYVSFSRTSAEGAATVPSEIVSELDAIIPLHGFIDDRNLSSIDRIASPVSAFEECALNLNANTAYSEALREFVSQGEYAHRLEAVRGAAENAPYVINDKSTAVQLFSQDMYISPSKADAFYKCAFSYFCRYGLRISRLSPADLDARVNGLLIHHLLEKILLPGRNKALTLLTEAELRGEIDEITEDFVAERMGGREGMSVLLNRSLDKAKETAYQILVRMISEFRVSKFETVAVELDISYGEKVEPYSIKLPDGGSITVSGQVDRVDIFNDEGKAYLRVVDYKTGGKDFKLGDVFSGLNMQMLIYLMCLWDNGKQEYGDIVPAGILYVPANNSGEAVSRNATEEEIQQQRLLNGRMNGMILDNEKVHDAMEQGRLGRFIDAGFNKKGKLTGAFLSLGGFAALHGKIDEMLVKMGVSLHNGEIAALPVTGTDYKKTCEYCDYKDICRHTETDEFREIKSIKHEDAVKMLEGSDDNG